MKLRKLFAVGLAVAMCITSITACSIGKTSKEDTKIGAESFTYVKDSTFIVKDGKLVKQSKNLKQSEIVEWYMDPYCPSCVKLDEIIAPKADELSKKMAIRYHAMGFLSAKTVDDYSNRASAFILSVAETNPKLAVKFLHEIMSDKFKPESGKGIKTPDSRFREAFKNVGGTDAQWEEVLKIHPAMLEMVKTQTAKAFNDEKLLSKAPEGRLTVPFIVVGDSEKALNFLDTVDAETFVLDSVNDYLLSKSSVVVDDKKATDKAPTVTDVETSK